ncbi:MAG: hypothetical protein EP344_13660 [Bacteroidetes bacterium]|nr:MAG: hypothetical protein EP344_13660 [Bacteroidota bacterium]
MRVRIVFNILAFLGVLVVNYLANALPLNGNTPGQLADQYPNLFVPAGLTFSIWGVIYIWLLLWIGAQAIALFSEKWRNMIGPSVEKSGYLFVLSCLLNTAWLFAWHWNMIALSVVIMVGLLIVVVLLNRHVGTGHLAASAPEKWLAHAPFGIYQGWITIALIANTTTLLVAAGWAGGGFSEPNWAILMILAGVLIANSVVRNTNNIFHGLAVAWALFGIYLKRSGDIDASFINVGTAALAGILLILIWVVIRLQRWLAY